MTTELGRIVPANMVPRAPRPEPDPDSIIDRVYGCVPTSCSGAGCGCRSTRYAVNEGRWECPEWMRTWDVNDRRVIAWNTAPREWLIPW